MDAIRVLMVSKACIRASYRRKPEELARFPDLKLRVVVPPGWREEGVLTLLEEGRAEGYELAVERMALNGHFHLHFYPHLARHFREFRPQILHMDEEPYNLATFQAFRLGVRFGAKCLFFTWQNIPKRYPFPFSLMESYDLRQAAFALAGNSAAASILRDKGYAGPLEVIPQFGVDPEVFCPREGPSGDERGRPFTIGYVGRLIEAKGVQVLLRALACLPSGDWRLRVLGSGPYQRTLEELARELGLGKRVAFHRPLPSAELPGYLRELDALVLPSLTWPQWKEQFGRVLVEAMACGIPVVGSDSGEIPYVVGEGGVLFPEGDAEALAGRIAELQSDERLRRELARRGRERVLAHYTQAQVARATYQVYRRMLEGGGTGASML